MIFITVIRPPLVGKDITNHFLTRKPRSVIHVQWRACIMQIKSRAKRFFLPPGEDGIPLPATHLYALVSWTCISMHIITCISDACISDARRHRSSIAPDERRHKSSPSSAEVLSSQQCTTGDLRRGNKMQANSECAPASGRV